LRNTYQMRVRRLVVHRKPQREKRFHAEAAVIRRRMDMPGLTGGQLGQVCLGG
jgi:hypothetical protein